MCKRLDLLSDSMIYFLKSNKENKMRLFRNIFELVGIAITGYFLLPIIAPILGFTSVVIGG